MLASLISARSRWDLTEIQKESNLTARSLQSQRDVENLDANSTRSWRDLSNLGAMEEISLRFRNSQTSWWDLGHLGEMGDISPQSCRDLESHKHHGEISTISARFRQSWQDGEYLATISPRFRILQTSWWDLGKISAISARSLQSRQDLSKNFARAAAGMNFKSWDINVIYSSLSCVLDRVLICCLRDSMLFCI